MAMVNEMDSHLGRIVQALKDKGFWENTLLLGFGKLGPPKAPPACAHKRAP
jgi:arylsulfatase A-like enzyme